ncbi:hypothetical protein LWI28_007686 [Acer negundo]|uniref:Uncharacterized protein n=1 Tax=Acer negundo TaxID=4023 RepID=A0AAD5P2E5_ACENE|nr:hypothetical protein LWI28_007686 [Acer negundo]
MVGTSVNILKKTKALGGKNGALEGSKMVASSKNVIESSSATVIFGNNGVLEGSKMVTPSKNVIGKKKGTKDLALKRHLCYSNRDSRIKDFSLQWALLLTGTLPFTLKAASRKLFSQLRMKSFEFAPGIPFRLCPHGSPRSNHK